MELAAKANKALFNVHGKTYLVGDAAHTIYVSNGDSMDWVKQNLRQLKLAFPPCCSPVWLLVRCPLFLPTWQASACTRNL